MFFTYVIEIKATFDFVVDGTLKCIGTKESSGYNVYAAMNGYDFAKGNPMDRNGDPGVRNRIFLHDCTNTLVVDKQLGRLHLDDGYYSFIGDVRKDMSCSSDFKMTSITTEEAYSTERSSSNDVSHSASASASKYNDIEV